VWSVTVPYAHTEICKQWGVWEAQTLDYKGIPRDPACLDEARDLVQETAFTELKDEKKPSIGPCRARLAKSPASPAGPKARTHPFEKSASEIIQETEGRRRLRAADRAQSGGSTDRENSTSSSVSGEKKNDRQS